MEVTIFNAFVSPANPISEPMPGGSVPANEPAFGGETNQVPAEQTTTVTEGGAQSTLEGMSLQAGGTTFASGNQSTNVPISNPNILWGAAAAATLGATLAEWQRRREEEEAARRAAMQNSSGGDEDDENSDVLAKRRAKVMAKNQAKRDQEQAWENARTTQKTQQMQNAIAKNNNLAQAEAEMGKVKPVTPYVAASYIDKDEEKRLKGQESQRAWAAVHAQEDAKKAEQERLNDVYAARWEGIKDIELEKQQENNSELVCEKKERDNPLSNLTAFLGGLDYNRYENSGKAETPDARHSNTMWGEARSTAERWDWGWSKTLEKIKDYTERSALNTALNNWSNQPDKTLRWKMELQNHWSSFTGKTGMLWDAFRRNGFSGVNVRGDDLLDFTGNTADITSIAANTVHLVTGDERAKTVGDLAEVAGVPAAAMQIINNWKPALQAIIKGPTASKGVSFLGKVAGPLAIVTGGFSIYSGIQDIQVGRSTGDTTQQVTGTLDTIAGVTAVLGGITLLIPGAQPVAAVLFGVSAIASVGSLVVENWGAVQTFFTRPEGPYPGIRNTP